MYEVGSLIDLYALRNNVRYTMDALRRIRSITQVQIPGTE